MKPRYQGIFSLSLSFLVLSAMGGYYFSGLWQAELAQSQPGPVPMADLKVPSEAQVKAMRQLMSRLPDLAVPQSKAFPAVSMTLFGQKNFHSARDAGGDQETRGERGGQHLLSATLLAGAARFCILDGAFVAEGARLPDGALLTRIENKRVKLVKQGQTNWIRLKEEMADKVPAAETPQKGPS